MQNEKTRATVRIAGRDYTIASYDSSEYVSRVAAYVDRKMNELSLATRLPAGQLAVLAAVNATDDMMKSRDEIDRLRREIESLRDDAERMKLEIEARDQEIGRLKALNGDAQA
ncbi:MAG: cell division protein ZapA [Clostridia bacterium]|nr:cell division protein ZapA [Clostridia bacterium]